VLPLSLSATASPEMAGSCERLACLGAVTGVIGNLQALEAIKIITGLHGASTSFSLPSSLDIFTRVVVRWQGDLAGLLGAWAARRSETSSCARANRAVRPCGVEGQKAGRIEDTDYVQFCGGRAAGLEERGRAGGAAGTRISPQVGFLARAHALRPKTETMTLAGDCVDIMHSKDIAIIDRFRTQNGIWHLLSSVVDPYVLCSACSACFLPSRLTQRAQTSR